MTLGLIDSGAGALLSAAMSSTYAETQHYSVALVAGDSALRTSVKLLLTAAGVVVREYRAIDAYPAGSPAPRECLVVDYRGPGVVSPRRWLQEIRQRAAGSPVIALTARPDELETCAPAEADLAIVGKPFDSEHLLDTIRKLTAPAPRRVPGYPQGLNRNLSQPDGVSS